MWGPMPDSGSEIMATEERGVTPRVFEQLFARIQQVLFLIIHAFIYQLISNLHCLVAFSPPAGIPV